MGFIARRSRLERLALIALLATVVSIAVVVTGVLHDRPSTSASRLTELCRPIASAITHVDPREVDRRDVLRLQQESAAAARGLSVVIKDASQSLRRTLIDIRYAFEQAGQSNTLLTLEVRVRFLAFAERKADSLGARCPAPLERLEARSIDRRLRAERG